MTEVRHGPGGANVKPEHEYSVTVAGPGALGLLVAARLARAGCKVRLLDHRPERAALLARSGITVEESNSIWTAHPAITADPAAARADVIIVCVKAFSTGDLCRQIAPHVTPSTIILSLQNGLGNVESLLRLPAGDVLAGVTGTGALLLAPGRVRSTGDGITWIATARGGITSVDTVAAALRNAGFDTRYHPDLRVMLWTKLILNAAINPLTARYRLLNGELLGHPLAGPLARQVVAECVTVANATGIPVRESEMITALEELCRNTARNRSSMLRDVEQGRPTERNAITGAIVAQAEALGIRVPVNRGILEHTADHAADESANDDH